MARADVTRELALWRAYEQAVFRVFDEGRPITFRIGRTSPRLDKLLERHGARRWAHITAWNPSSVPLPKAENLRRQRRLVAELKRGGFGILEGEGADPKRRWTPEPTAFVLGIGVREARQLGREYDQLAIVVGQRGKLPRLVACRPRSLVPGA
ncbi:MAG TPA: DUF3293 domain-containing protein [Aeromicrobium sp.]|nr:DUF3293 domain-containing protein [Aeromicrobium sp.]